MIFTAIVRKHIHLTLCLLLLLTLVFFPRPSFTGSNKTNVVKERPFQPGEKLIYRARWGMLPAGEVTLEILPMETINGREAYHFAMVTKTNTAVDLIYKIRERQDSYIDADLSHSILYRKRSEGRHPRDVLVNFNWEKREAVRSNFGEKMDPIKIVPGTFDPLALFFVMRLHDIKKNPVVEIPITAGDRLIIVKAYVTQKEVITIGNTKYDTFQVIPDMERLEKEKVVKKSDDPELRIWFTADEKKIPVKIQSKVKAGGYFSFELASIER